MNAQGMNVTFDVGAERGENHPVSLDAIATVESLRHDPHIKVPFALFGADVASVQMTLVLDQEFARFEGSSQQPFDLGNPFGGHGSTCLKGFTVTLA